MIKIQFSWETSSSPVGIQSAALMIIAATVNILIQNTTKSIVIRQKINDAANSHENRLNLRCFQAGLADDPDQIPVVRAFAKIHAVPITE